MGKARSEKKKERRELNKIKRREKRGERKKYQRQKKSLELGPVGSEERKIAQLAIEKEKTLQEEFAKENFEHGNFKVTFNCSFCDQMNPTELKSLAKQIHFAYMALKKEHALKEKFPRIRLQVSSVTENSELSGFLSERACQRWHMEITSKSFWELHEAHLDRVIALSPDAEEVLEEIPENAIFIIGGLVDRSVAKSESKTQASLHGVKTRRLPIKECGMKPLNSVLTVTGAFEVILWRLITGDWKETFEKTLPRRKLVPRKQRTEESNKKDDDENEKEADENDDEENDNEENDNEENDNEENDENDQIPDILESKLEV